ncbi:MAG: hypothetical protein COU07_00720 [Candidatus Harrisonbacteria bacterium CG10_big_fil_rev_8_21_14_0_10_40_38]|uniref:Uncharacterized protein n=1 Tax=Candidatus Harrisonbacteria bacterium CG10_big_fil_rev_8_21_14_0_10_40_38 TaxID=1974583 RepID=A0A2H0USL9_9BACT|nr:MAG: hypothetical protein COU07_00720 [Candidatus Harrisonbacteria bacterium CG10_big_fil_rev_8_21_14_0_10_40_38]
MSWQKLYKNWPAIARLARDERNSKLGLLLMTETDQVILETIKLAMPYLFTDTPCESISKSVLIEAAFNDIHSSNQQHEGNQESEEDERELARYMWDRGCVSLSIPIVCFRAGFSSDDGAEGMFSLVAPPELYIQVQNGSVGDKSKCDTDPGLIVTINGGRLLLVGSCEDDVWYFVPEECVDLNS